MHLIASTFNQSEQLECLRLLAVGLAEDLGEAGDITSQCVVPAESRAVANVVARKDGVIAGLQVWQLLAAEHFPNVRVDFAAIDGPVAAGTSLARLRGPTRELLAMERLGLNLLSRLSGVATLTARYVAAVAGTHARVCDTRKTTPGYRHLEKYAVRIGGGTNHRMALYDGILIKDNHLFAMTTHGETSAVVRAVQLARTTGPANAVVEIEVDSLPQLERALSVAPDIVLLDNMPIENLSVAVEMRDMLDPRVQLEASGGIDLTTIAAVAATGVERISVGAITHSAPILDIALDFVQS